MNNPNQPPSNIPYVIAVVVMSALGLITVLVITILNPGTDNTSVIATVFGFLAPTTMALLAFLKANETHSIVNSRMGEFHELIKRDAKAEGIVEGAKAETIIAVAVKEPPKE